MNVNNVRIDNMQSKKYDFVMKVLRGEEYAKQQDNVKTKKTEKDSYSTSMENVKVTYEVHMTHDMVISDTLLDVINFEPSATKLGEDTVTVSGITMYIEQIPKVGIERCSDIKAEDNKVVIKDGTYYKYADEHGEYHVLSCRNSHLGTPRSEQYKGVLDEKNNKRASFWNILSEGSPYIGLYYTAEEEKQILNEAGITEGFFTVQVGSKKGEYFLADGRYVHGAIPRWRYESKYNMLMNRDRLFDEYDVGSVFLIDGKEYVLSENKKLDIPYGVDIFDFTYPPKTQKKE